MAGNTTQDIALGNPALSGAVTVLATGLPVSGATVSAWNAGSGAWVAAGVTNGSGLYTITLPAGSYKLYVQPASGPAVWFGGTSKATATTVVVAGNTTQDIALGNPALSGAVTVLATGLPVSGATCPPGTRAAGPGPPPASPTAPGCTRITLPAGSYKLYVQPASGPAVWFGGTSKATATTVVVAGNTTQDIALGNPALSGAVTVLATGLPVSGATVSAWNAGSGAWVAAGVTNGSGLYTITLPAGSYKLYVQPASGPAVWFGGTSKATATTVVVAGNTTQNIAL